jgi:hypothetical protein
VPGRDSGGSDTDAADAASPDAANFSNASTAHRSSANAAHLTEPSAADFGAAETTGSHPAGTKAPRCHPAGTKATTTASPRQGPGAVEEEN